ncbi:unnamed protein product [Lactuca virosa]|uniref:Uncharacterized protein n=1 Tax=Lactuca virosa TaxID=75947 RepID=A0AAU9N2U4_9ASTR|nr:unnamed protein product [Lactuca virosa]
MFPDGKMVAVKIRRSSREAWKDYIYLLLSSFYGLQYYPEILVIRTTKKMLKVETIQKISMVRPIHHLLQGFDSSHLQNYVSYLDNGMRAAFQLLHMVLEHSVWLEDAFDRAGQLYSSYYHSIPKILERSAAD